MLSASPLLCNIFWCFLTDSQANGYVLSVFRLYSDVVADIRHAFIVHACSWFFSLLLFICTILYVVLPTGVLNCSIVPFLSSTTAQLFNHAPPTLGEVFLNIQRVIFMTGCCNIRRGNQVLPRHEKTNPYQRETLDPTDFSIMRYIFDIRSHRCKNNFQIIIKTFKKWLFKRCKTNVRPTSLNA